MYMNKDNLKPLLLLAEKLTKRKALNEEIAVLEFEKFFNCIIQGLDITNVFERRHVGIVDEEWNVAKKQFFNEIGIKYEE